MAHSEVGLLLIFHKRARTEKTGYVLKEAEKHQMGVIDQNKDNANTVYFVQILNW